MKVDITQLLIVFDGLSTASDEESGYYWFEFKRTDEESGLVYFGLRYYDPHIGRWITMDPDGFKDGLGLYAYVHNNPLTHFDAFGLSDTFGISTYAIPPLNMDYLGICSWGFGRTFTEGLWHIPSGNCTLNTYSTRPVYTPNMRFSSNEFASPFHLNYEKDQLIDTQQTVMKQMEIANSFKIGVGQIPNNISAIYVHGMFNTFEDSLVGGVNFSKAFGGREIIMISHPQKNGIKEISSLLAFMTDTKSSRSLERTIATVFWMERLMNKNVILASHSKGALVTYRTIENYITDPEDRAHLAGITIGGAKFLERNMGYQIFNVSHVYDIISGFCENTEIFNHYVGEPTRTNVTRVFGLCPEGLDRLEYHRADNPDYVKEISRIVKDLVNNPW